MAEAGAEVGEQFYEGIRPHSQTRGVIHLTTSVIADAPAAECVTKCGRRNLNLLPLKWKAEGDRRCRACFDGSGADG